MKKKTKQNKTNYYWFALNFHCISYKTHRLSSSRAQHLIHLADIYLYRAVRYVSNQAAVDSCDVEKGIHITHREKKRKENIFQDGAGERVYEYMNEINQSI